MAAEFAVRADFFQYYVADPTQYWDAAPADDRHDGVLAPLETATLVGTGAKAARPQVSLTVYATPDGFPEPVGVAAACDLWLPGGIVAVCDFDRDVCHQHDFGAPTRCRLLVEVAGRDETDLFGDPPERHTLSVAPTDVSQPRWRSTTLDEVGRRLAA